MLLLRNSIQPYAWGLVDGIAQAVGSEPTGAREAELWIGTHPRGPSVVAAGEHEGRTLAAVIAEDPVRWLGPVLAASGATALPFLLKVLAIGCPLSLQAHPSAEQAIAGFAREEASGLPIDAPERSYRDASPKPEALVALEETWALCGFREPIEAANLLAGLGVEAMDPLIAILATGDHAGLRTVLSWLLTLDPGSAASVAASVAQAVSRVRGEDDADPRIWVRRLVDAFPGDPTVVAPLVLNIVRLDPGACVHLPAGNLHAYLRGSGVEIMAASDNVLRGGLTPKHVDVDELLAVLRFEAGVPSSPDPTEVRGGVSVYDAGEESFALAVVDPDGGEVEVRPNAPSLLLATGGQVVVTGPDGTLTLAGSAAAYVAPGDAPIHVTGTGRLWWATTGAGLPR